MVEHIRLGILVPSSNTALEPITHEIIRTFQAPRLEISAHFSRFTVTEISLSQQALGQFSLEKIISAARLLADAKVHVIGWSGTSAGWLGFEHDEKLCVAVTEASVKLQVRSWARWFVK